MDRNGEHERDRNGPVQGQHNGKLIEDHAEQARQKGGNHRKQQEPFLSTEALSVYNGMYDAQQKEQNGCQLLNMNTGKWHHNGECKGDQQEIIQNLLHIDPPFCAGIVFTPKQK